MDTSYAHFGDCLLYSFDALVCQVTSGPPDSTAQYFVGRLDAVSIPLASAERPGDVISNSSSMSLASSTMLSSL